MKRSTLVFTPFLVLVACGGSPEANIDSSSEKIVNGTVTDTPEFQAVVSLRLPGDHFCSGTFIHPNFILTAAHCIPLCTSTVTTGCVAAESKDDIWDGDTVWVGRNGDVSVLACTGVNDCETGDGTLHTTDRVFFPRPSDFDPSEAPLDLAILHTTRAFTGQPIAVMSASDLPSRANLCSRYELTRPSIAGFADNDDPSLEHQRRVGIAEVECDLAMNERAFKLDGHGRPFVGSRGCAGDSGGPALWRNGSGVLTLGGVMSYTDTTEILGVACPSERGETGVSFVARSFIDRVVSSLSTTVLGGLGTIASSPGGISCGYGGGDCFENFDSNTMVTLTATPAAGNLFQGWSGACAGSASTCTVSVTSALRVTANFAAIQQPLTVRVQPAGAGSVRINPPNTLCSGTCFSHYTIGSNVALTAQPAPGYVFSKWSGSCAGSHTTSCALAMTAARSTDATFCPADDACCLNPASCQTCNPKQCPKSVPDCCL